MGAKRRVTHARSEQHIDRPFGDRFSEHIDLVQRRIQKIHVPLHYLIGFASIFPSKADRFEWIDALGCNVTAGLCDDLGARVGG